MAQELPAIAVAPGTAALAKSANESTGNTEQADEFRGVLQSALGGQAIAAEKGASTTPASRSTAKDSPKSKEAEKPKDGNAADDTDALQAMVNKALGAATIDLAAILMRSVSLDTATAQSPVTKDVSPTNTNGQQLPAQVAGPVAAAAESSVLAASGVVPAVLEELLTTPAQEPTPGLVQTPGTKTDTNDKAAAANAPQPQSTSQTAKPVELALTPLPVPEKAEIAKEAEATPRNLGNGVAPAKEAPAPAKNAAMPVEPSTTTTSPKNETPDHPVTIQSREVTVSNGTSQRPQQPGDAGMPPVPPVHGNESARTANVQRALEETIVQPAAVAGSSTPTQETAEKENPGRVQSSVARQEKPVSVTMQQDATQAQDNGADDRSGKKDQSSTSASFAKAQSRDPHAETIAVPKTTFHSAAVQVPTTTNLASKGDSGTGLPIPLPRELSRAVIDQVIKGFTLTVSDTAQEVKVTLKPEALGDVVLKMKMEDGRLQAQIDVAQPAVKAAVESQLTDLRQALADRGIDLQHIEVIASGQSANVADGQSQRGNRFKQKAGKRHEGADGIDEIQQARSLGYNTLEVIM